MKEELIKELIECSDFKSQFSFLKEEDIRKKYGDKLYEEIYKDFSDHWSYELSERLDSIDIKALISAAVEKAVENLGDLE